MKRLFDLALALIASVILALPILLVAILVKLTSQGPILYWSDRVGQNNRLFRMPKFRTMDINTPAVATHLLSDPAQHLKPLERQSRGLREVPLSRCEMRCRRRQSECALPWMAHAVMFV